MQEKKNIPWRRFAIIGGIISGILVICYLSLHIAYASDFDSNRRSAYIHVAEEIKNVFGWVFDFLHPFIQLAVLLFVVNWAVKRFNIKLEGFQWQQVNVEKFVVVALTVGFIALALMGRLDSLAYTKDLALVALAFYFGGLRKT